MQAIYETITGWLPAVPQPVAVVAVIILGSVAFVSIFDLLSSVIRIAISKF